MTGLLEKKKRVGGGGGDYNETSLAKQIAQRAFRMGEKRRVFGVQKHRLHPPPSFLSDK